MVVKIEGDDIWNESKVYLAMLEEKINECGGEPTPEDLESIDQAMSLHYDRHFNNGIIELASRVPKRFSSPMMAHVMALAAGAVATHGLMAEIGMTYEREEDEDDEHGEDQESD